MIINIKQKERVTKSIDRMYNTFCDLECETTDEAKQCVYKQHYNNLLYIKLYVEQLHGEIDRLNELLKEKQPKKGHWTPYDRYGVNDARDYECSVCKRVFSWNTDFCPMCGADMREEGDGE